MSWAADEAPLVDHPLVRHAVVLESEEDVARRRNGWSHLVYRRGTEKNDLFFPREGVDVAELAGMLRAHLAACLPEYHGTRSVCG